MRENIQNAPLEGYPRVSTALKNNIFDDLKILLAVLLILLIPIVIIFSSISKSNNELTWSKESFPLSKSKYIFGLDVSHYQGRINWNEVKKSKHPIGYVFIRSTMGADGKDFEFERNWKNTKQKNFLRGAYHYYRPNENSTKQFNNFKSVVNIEKGDFIPVLDIENESKYGRENLRKGVLNWLKLAEKHYGVKPMIYTGLNFYKHVLKGHVDGYPLWIASYTEKSRLNGVDWDFHQFTENVRVKGIKSNVDGNDFNGSLSDLRNFVKR